MTLEMELRPFAADAPVEGSLSSARFRSSDEQAYVAAERAVLVAVARAGLGALEIHIMLFHDPALVFRCDVPWGWCLDGESSLFRIAFRPWDRLDERVIVTARPVSIVRNATDAEWTAAIDAETQFDAIRSIRLAACTARLFHPAGG